MRWPFSLLFRGDRDAPAAATGSAGASGAPSGAGHAPALSPRPAAWRGLPPVQRTVGDAPVTAAAGPFARGLASRHPPEPILRPLAHDVAADGPAGLVSGIASPLVAPATAAPVHPEAAPLPMVGDAVQRRSRRVSVARAPLAPSSSVDEGVAATAPAAEPAAAMREPVMRMLPVARVAVTALAATRVASTTAPEPPQPRALAALEGSAAVEAAPDGTGRGIAAAVDPTTPATAPPGGSPAAAPPAPGAPGGTAGDAVHAQRRTLGESRRLGLGAPLAHRPGPRTPAPAPALPVARSAGPGPSSTRVAAAAAPAPLPVLRVAADTSPTDAAPSSGAQPPRAGMGTGDGDSGSDGETGPGTPPASTSPLLGDATRHDEPAVAEAVAASEAAARRADMGTLSLAVPRAADAHPSCSGSGAATSGSAASGAAITAPLVAARAAAGAAEPLRASLASTSTAPSVVVARRAVTPLVPLEAPPGVGGTAQVTAPTTGRSAGEAAPVIARPRASAQREADGATGAGGSRGSAPLGAGARLAVQLAGTAIGGVRTSSADQPGGPGWSGVAASADGGASPGARSDLVLPVVARLAADAAPSAATPGPALGWTADRGFGPLPAGAGPVVQRVVEVGEVAAQVEPGSQSGGTGTGAGAGSGSGPDYEEIAEHVYDRIRSRIALELLLDRERMGLLIDG